MTETGANDWTETGLPDVGEHEESELTSKIPSGLTNLRSSTPSTDTATPQSTQQSQKAAPARSKTSPMPPAIRRSSMGVRGIEALNQKFSQHGISEDHLKKLAEFADEKEVAFAIRPVNPYASRLIKKGHPTKDLEIKGKSSDWGPMAGCIPVLEELNKNAFKKTTVEAATPTAPQEKAEGDTQGKVLSATEVFFKIAEETKQQQKADTEEPSNPPEIMQLVLDKQDLHELSALGAIQNNKKTRMGRLFNKPDLTITSEKNGITKTFEAYSQSKLPWANSKSTYKINYEGKPLEVLGRPNPSTNQLRAITADYDLLIFAVPIEHYGDSDMHRKSITPSLEEHSPMATHSQTPVPLEKTSSSGKRFFQPVPEQRPGYKHSALQETTVPLVTSPKKQTPTIKRITPRLRNSFTPAFRQSKTPTNAESIHYDQGFISKRQIKLLAEANTKLGREPGNGIFQHGPDTENPASKPEENIPCVYFGPKKHFGEDNVWMATSKDELVKSYKDIKNRYQFFPNNNWEKGDVEPREPFINSKESVSPGISAMLAPDKRSKAISGYVEVLEQIELQKSTNQE